MATDPYHAVQQEIQTSLQTANQLLASFVRIRNMAQRTDSEELVWAGNELKATLTSLEADLEDLEESVKIVESTDARMFGIDDAEVAKRRNYVTRVRSEIQRMRMEVSTNPQQQASGSRTPTRPSTPGHVTPSYGDPAVDDDSQAEWARQEQQMMIREQDQTMDSIAGTLTTLAQQAGLMGQEIGVHNEMLDDLEQGADRTDNKLNASMLRMRKFIRQTEEKGSGWCIIILIIVLCILLLAVILV